MWTATAPVSVIACRFVAKSSKAHFSNFYNFLEITSYGGALSVEILNNVDIAIRIGFSECVTTCLKRFREIEVLYHNQRA